MGGGGRGGASGSGGRGGPRARRPLPPRRSPHPPTTATAPVLSDPPLPPPPRAQGEGARLLQVARSVPGVLCTLVGHKRPEHIEQNVRLSEREPLTDVEFIVVMGALNRASNKE